MIFTETRLRGAFVVEMEQKQDDRGFFARTFCATEFAAHGLNPAAIQCNLSYNYRKGTLRGMHYQVAPFAEVKYVRCLAGAVCDVIVDMRPDSPTYLQHVAVELTAANRRSLYIPEMFAHGYLTLSDDAEVCYQVSQVYGPGSERGLRYDDPKLRIAWPVPVTTLSPKDAAWPLL